MTIVIKDKVSGTLSNIEGLNLFYIIERELENSDVIILSFGGINTISSSFLNSSIGAIIDKYGIEILKEKIKITNYTRAIANTILKYVEDVTINRLSDR